MIEKKKFYLAICSFTDEDAIKMKTVDPKANTIAEESDEVEGNLVVGEKLITAFLERVFTKEEHEGVSDCFLKVGYNPRFYGEGNDAVHVKNKTRNDARFKTEGYAVKALDAETEAKQNAREKQRYERGYNKNFHLRKVRDKFREQFPGEPELTEQQCVLFDDDIENVKAAQMEGYYAAHAVTGPMKQKLGFRLPITAISNAVNKK